MSEDDDKTRILRGRPEDELPTRILAGRPDDGDRTRILSGGQVVASPDEDDDRTRILGSSPDRPAPAGTPGDRIVFQCPNGHRIVVGKQFAGKRGKCNKCGADVQIPMASKGPTIPPPPPPPFVIGPPADEADEGSQEATEGDESQALGGPQLGDLFSLPSVTDDEGSEKGADPGDEKVEWNFDVAAMGSEDREEEAPGWGGVGGPSFDMGEGNPTARLVARLWHEREHGGIMELHLEGGAILLPEWYESKWSKGSHGLFASQAPDGSVTLTAVAWESVQKVVVRQLAAVPDDMFT